MFGGAAAVLLSSAPAGADTIGPITFETPTYTLGNINAQDGWTKTGGYDAEVVDNSGFTGAPGSFGAQSLRISDAVASGSFGDQTFSKPTVNAGGEPGATAGPHTPGTLQPTFSASFSFASATGAAQPGLHVSVSPDRGDGARMSYVRIEDNGSYGFNVFFDDYRDKAPVGSSSNLGDGCTGTDDFYETQIAAGLSYTDAHTIAFDMQFVPGPRNDIVKVSVDGVPAITGTSWEDYFRYCEATDTTRDVQNLLFRVSGTATPANVGNGFLIDGVSEETGPVAATVPGAPVKVNGSPGNKKAIVHWVAPTSNGGSPIDGYKVIPVINGVNQPAQTFNSTATTQTLTLTNGVTYKFKVAAHNAVGYGPTTATPSGTTVGAPSAPTKPTVTHPAAGSLKLTFKKPNANGSPITGYTAQCVSNNGSQTKGTESTITVSGLTVGQSYTCSVRATNSRGTGPASLRSAPMTA